MKYLKLFENIIEDIIKKQDEVKNEKDKVLKLIDEYVLLHEEMWKKWDFEDSYNHAFDFNLFNWDDEKYISVDYYYDDDEETSDLSLNLNDFLEFAKDPDLHKNMKKYNL
jgi:hypothetical protein